MIAIVLGSLVGIAIGVGAGAVIAEVHDRRQK